MTATHTGNTARDGFVARFFGDGNDLDLDALPDAFRAWLDPWLRALDEPHPHPVVLPRRQGAHVEWYALAFHDEQARMLEEDLRAFVGPSYSDFTGVRAHLDPANPVDAAARAVAGGRVYRFSVVPADPGTLADARQSLDLMRQTWIARPHREFTRRRPTGRVLRDFELALRQRNAVESEALLDELDRDGHLNEQNLTFLQLRRLAALGRHQELLDQPTVDPVVQLRPPLRVAEVLIDAVYHVHLAPAEVAGDAQSALTRFADTVLPRYSPLFRSHVGMRTPQARKCFMLYAAVVNPPRVALRDDLLTEAETPLSAADRAWLTALAAHVPGPPSVPPAGSGRPAQREAEDPLDLARRAFAVGDHERATAMAAKAPPSSERALLLLECAVEHGGLESGKHALNALDALDEDSRAGLLASRRVALQVHHLRGGLLGDATAQDTEGAVPDDWVAWLERLNVDPWAGALPVAERGAREWSLATLLNDPSQLDRLTQLLVEDRPAAAQATLRDALPYILEFFRVDAPPIAALRGVYEALHVALLAEEALSISAFDAAVDLTANLIGLGVAASDYTTLVGDLIDAWEQLDAAAHLDWALRALDALIDLPSGDPSARERFLHAVTASFSRWWRRTQDYQWALLDLLAADLGLRDIVARPVRDAEDAAVAPQDAPDPRVLAGRRVAVYTLTAAAGRRVKQYVEHHFEEAMVDVTSETVCTERLRALSASADIFIVATRSAKHAATDCIQANRSADLATLYPDGAGSASMIRVLHEYIETSHVHQQAA